MQHDFYILDLSLPYSHTLRFHTGVINLQNCSLSGYLKDESPIEVRKRPMSSSFFNNFCSYYRMTAFIPSTETECLSCETRTIPPATIETFLTVFRPTTSTCGSIVQLFFKLSSPTFCPYKEVVPIVDIPNETPTILTASPIL